MKKVLAFGTFDLLHPGHINFLEQCKSQGDHLTVVIARDANVKNIKGNYPSEDEKTRKKKVAEIESVDEVIMGYKDFKKRMDIIRDVNPKVICLGYDQNVKLPGGKYSIHTCEPYQPEKYKTSLLKSC
ncbi:adenylyltransferase/cytidyltransferase family protein [Patescibacteria group bacterium]|nr:adenylyltransferase/cytidyltransferase family protein [Patescibacteria group bacterium]MBU1673807.1 adenylyltransferase/cytidyltransferase family protein [Patescibacteria group bacterium]MBU1963771.1 adenylyltransferase/cytidyltransferase family protein [Patescibacteria group bacterium]